MSAGLEHLQATFAGGILGAGDTIAILGELRGSTSLDAARRFAIYSEAYRARLLEALRGSFGHTATYLGDQAFDELALGYVERHPPVGHNVRWYGDAFPAWLRTALSADPEVAELASLDWALRSAFDSLDADPLRPAELARLGPEDWTRIGLRLHPAFRILELRWNTLALWQALDRDETPPAAVLLAESSALLIWRRELQPHFRTLEPGEDRALQALHGGDSFATVCALIAENRPPQEAAALAGRWLRRWIDEALLVEPA